MTSNQSSSSQSNHNHHHNEPPIPNQSVIIQQNNPYAQAMEQYMNHQQAAALSLNAALHPIVSFPIEQHTNNNTPQTMNHQHPEPSPLAAAAALHPSIPQDLFGLPPTQYYTTPPPPPFLQQSSWFNPYPPPNYPHVQHVYPHPHNFIQHGLPHGAHPYFMPQGGFPPSSFPRHSPSPLTRSPVLSQHSFIRKSSSPLHPKSLIHLSNGHQQHPNGHFHNITSPTSPQLSPGPSPLLSLRNLMSPVLPATSPISPLLIDTQNLSPAPLPVTGPSSKTPALPSTTILGGSSPKWSKPHTLLNTKTPDTNLLDNSDFPNKKPKFLLGQRIGCGSFGCVYKGQWVQQGSECTPDLTQGYVAIKVEPIPDIPISANKASKQVHPGLLPTETQILLQMSSEHGFPAIYWYGEFSVPSGVESTTIAPAHQLNSHTPVHDPSTPNQHRTYRALVMQLLGPSLQDLFDKCGKKLSVKTVCLIADQLIQRLERLHVRGFLHRDLKPENVLLGNDLNNNPQLYLIDFGLAQPRHQNTDPPPKRAEKCVGTLRYMPRNSHRGKPQAPRDDLESLGYLLVFFLKGSLPWQRKNMLGRTKAAPQDLNDQKRAVLKSKEDHGPTLLCSGLPPAFAEYMTAVRSYRYTDCPDYLRLRNYFVDCVHSLGEQMDSQFDWDQAVGRLIGLSAPTLRLIPVQPAKISIGTVSSPVVNHVSLSNLQPIQYPIPETPPFVHFPNPHQLIQPGPGSSPFRSFQPLHLLPTRATNSPIHLVETRFPYIQPSPLSANLHWFTHPPSHPPSQFPTSDHQYSRADLFPPH